MRRIARGDNHRINLGRLDEEFSRRESLRARHARCGVLCTFGIDISDGADSGSGNCSRNRLDVIGSHDSRTR